MALVAGNVLAVAMGLLWGHWPKRSYVALLALASIGAAGVPMSRLNRLDALVHGSCDEDSEAIDPRNDR